MNSHPDQQRACAILTCLAEPADPLMGRLLVGLAPAAVIASIRSGAIPAAVAAELDNAHASGLGPRWPLAGTAPRHSPRRRSRRRAARRHPPAMPR